MSFVIPVDETPDFSMVGETVTSKSTAEGESFMNQYNAGLDRSLWSGLASVAAAPVDLVDTISSSLGITERGNINESFVSSVGAPGFNKWYNENRTGIELGSAVAGIVLADAVAGKILKPTSGAMRMVQGIRGVKNIATLDRQLVAATRLSELAQREVARRGLNEATRMQGLAMNFPYLGQGFTVSRAAADRHLFGVAATKGLVRNLTTEGVMAIGLNQNSILYSDSLVDNIMWGAAGLGIGGLLDSAVTAYGLRKYANSEQIRQLNRGAYDVSGLGEGLVNPKPIFGDPRANKATTDIMFGRSGGVTDEVTMLATSASELGNRINVGSERAVTLSAQREKLAAPQFQQAVDRMQQVTTRGFLGARNSGFNMTNEGEALMVRESLHRSPTSMYGIEGIAKAGDEGVEATFDAHKRAIQGELEQLQQGLRERGKTVEKTGKKGLKVKEFIPYTDEELEQIAIRQRELIAQNSNVPMVMFTPGEWMPARAAAVINQYKPREVISEGLGNNGVFQIARDKEFTTRLGMNEQLDLFLPDGKKSFNELSTHERIHMFHVGQAAVDSLAKRGAEITIRGDMNWFQLDLAEQLIQKTGDPSKVKFVGGLTREKAMVESYAQKVDEWNRLKKLVEGSENADQIDMMFSARVGLNLPMIDSYTHAMMGIAEDPTGLLLAGFKTGDEVRKMDHQQILKALNDSRVITGLTEEAAPALKSLHGDSFNFLLNNGKPATPVLGLRRPLNPYEFVRDELIVRNGLKQEAIKAELLGGDPLTRMITEHLTQDPSFVKSRDVLGLADDQIRSGLPGLRHAAPQEKKMSVFGAFMSKARRDVDNPTMLSQTAQNEIKQRATQAAVKATMEDLIGDYVTQITSTRNARSLMLLNQFGSFRGGWKLLDAPATAKMDSGDEIYKFVLDHTNEANQKRFQQQFGRALEKGQNLLNPNGTEIVLDKLAMEGLARIQQVHKVVLDAKNTVLRANGRPEIAVENWHWSPPALKGKYVAFTLDEANNVVPNMAIVADSPADLARQQAELRNSPNWRPEYRSHTKDEITRFLSTWDRAKMDFFDPSVNTAIQPGKVGGGKILSQNINEAAFADQMTSLRSMLLAHGNDVMETLHADTLKALETRAEIAKMETGIGQKKTVHESIYSKARDNLMGVSALNAKDSLLGTSSKALEDHIDGLLQKDQAKASMSPSLIRENVTKAYHAFTRFASPKDPMKGESFERFSKELGQYMPYKSVTEMLRNQKLAQEDPTVQGLANKLMWFEASARLRWFESAHSAATMGSMIANAPAIIKALQTRAGESASEAMARNSMIAMPIHLDTGQQIFVPNTPKLMWAAMRDMQKGSGIPAIEAAKKLGQEMGYMSQEVAEFNRAWGSVESKAGWKQFFMGDATREGNSHIDKFVRNGGIDKHIGMLTDKSENAARAWGMQMGYRVALAAGLEDPRTMNMLAHELTNKMIANYNPVNRAEVFQGPFGALAGLFQSYTVNFYERLFRYMETSESGAGVIKSLGGGRGSGIQPFAVQMATQGAVFGTASLPGWSTINDWFFDRDTKPGDDPVDSIYSRLGTEAGDLFLHGTLSNLPKLFGLEGVNLYTRGDSTMRIPGSEWNVQGGIPTPNIPVADTLTRIGRAIGQGASALMGEQPIGLNHLAEIASNAITNRPIAGFIESVGAGGYDTDWSGAVAAQSKGVMQNAYRWLGVRSMVQQKQLEQFYARKENMEEQAARKEQLRHVTRSAVRAGRYDEVPQFFADYVKAGGDPRQFNKWLNETYDAALQVRGTRALEKALKDKRNMSNAEIAVLLDGQIDPRESDEAEDDYGAEESRQQMIANKTAIIQEAENQMDPNYVGQGVQIF